MTEYWHGSRVIARFEPKDTATLRDCMRPLIGRTFEWEWSGVGESDEMYPGQDRWTIARKHDPEMPDECKGRWYPHEDLVITADQSRET